MLQVAAYLLLFISQVSVFLAVVAPCCGSLRMFSVSFSACFAIVYYVYHTINCGQIILFQHVLLALDRFFEYLQLLLMMERL